MTGHRKWRDIRNAVMDEPLDRHRRAELRCANDLALELGRLRDQRVASSAHVPPVAAGTAEAGTLAMAETKCLAALRESIEDLGGRLEIAAVFPDQRITLSLESCTDDETAGEQS